MVDDSPMEDAMSLEGAPSAEAAQAPRSEVAELRRQLDEKHDRLLRALADAENTRRRAQRERDEFAKYATESLLRDLIPVLDNLDRALDAARAAGLLRGPRSPTQRDRRGSEEGVPAARDAIPPRPQPGGQARRGALQGSQRGVCRPLRRRQARALRPVRDGRSGRGRGLHGHGLRHAVRGYLRELLLRRRALEPPLPRRPR